MYKEFAFSVCDGRALKNDIHIETSSAFDIPIIRSLYESEKINKDIYILCNGFKREGYIQGIVDLIKDGFTNVIPILDNVNELQEMKKPCRVKNLKWYRIASEEENLMQSFFISRLGIRSATYHGFLKTPFVKPQCRVEITPFLYQYRNS